MASQKTLIHLEEELKTAKEALDYIYAALRGDAMSYMPTKALSREVLNDALQIAGYPPVEDRQIQIIGCVK